MNKSEEKQVIVELTNGQKVRGTLVQVDKINLKMILENVKQEVNGKEETIDKLEIKKSDIKELKLVHFEMKAEEKQNINAIPENKIPQNQENTQKAYDKNESFFDKLTSMTHPEARNESKNYNQKNKDTFNLTEQDKSNQNNKKYYHNNNNNRGRGYNKYHNNKGRGGYNNNNYNKNYNNNYNNNRGGYGNFRGRGQRGRGYNNYYNNYQKKNNYNNNNNNNNNQGNNNNNPDTSKLKPYQPEGGIQPGMEKSIYDN
jgi:small nuclear ribonucleoprotein (snRNP)-like protein